VAAAAAVVVVVVVAVWIWTMQAVAVIGGATPWYSWDKRRDEGGPVGTDWARETVWWWTDENVDMLPIARVPTGVGTAQTPAQAEGVQGAGQRDLQGWDWVQVSGGQGSCR
jgi:hypothetical protein